MNTQKFKTIIALAMLLQVPEGMADVTISGQVEVTFVGTDSASSRRAAISDTESRDIGHERAIKLGAMGALLLNQETINNYLSALGNNAVRAPIGKVSLDYSSLYTKTVGQIHNDNLLADLVLPVGDDLGFSIVTGRSQSSPLTTTNDLSRATLFWNNPKEGSFSIGLSRTGERFFSDNEHHIDLELGYSIRNPDKGFLTFSLGKSIEGRHSTTLFNTDYTTSSEQLSTKWQSKSFSSGIYLDRLEFLANGLWTQVNTSGHTDLSFKRDSKAATAKYLWDKAALSLTRSISNTSSYNNFASLRSSYYPTNNLVFSFDRQKQIKHERWAETPDITTYTLQFEPDSSRFQINLEWKKFEVDIDDFYGINVTANLGRKRSLKAADRDRDPF